MIFWLLSILCCLLWILLLLTILANSFIYSLWRISNTVLIPDLSSYLFGDGMLLTILFQFPIFNSTSLSDPLQTVVSYLIPHSLATYATSIHYLWTAIPTLLLMFLLLSPQNVLFWTTYCRLLGLCFSQLSTATS